MRTLPKLENREAANKGAELIGAASGQRGSIVGGEFLELRVHLRGKKGDQQLQDVDSEPIGDDVESFNEVHAYGVDESDHHQEDPPVEHLWRRFVEHMLVTP